MRHCLTRAVRHDAETTFAERDGKRFARGAVAATEKNCMKNAQVLSVKCDANFFLSSLHQYVLDKTQNAISSTPNHLKFGKGYHCQLENDRKCQSLKDPAVFMIGRASMFAR